MRPKKSQKNDVAVFDEKSRREFVIGFRKRKIERRAYHKEKQDALEKQQKNEMKRKTKGEALKNAEEMQSFHRSLLPDEDPAVRLAAQAKFLEPEPEKIKIIKSHRVKVSITDFVAK